MRRNPRIMPVSERDINSLTHKALQILKTGLDYKLRREQQFWERKRKRDEEEQREFDEVYPDQKSKINYKALSTLADTLTGSTVINQAGFTYKDVRGQKIDGLLQVVAAKAYATIETNIYAMTALDTSKVVSDPKTKAHKDQTDAYTYIVSAFVGGGRNAPIARMVGDKRKQNILNIDFNVQDYSFEAVAQIINVPKDSFAYAILFNAVKRVVYHEFIHAMESFPKEYTPQIIEEEGFLNRLDEDFEDYLEAKFSKTGNLHADDYYDQLTERRAYLSEVLNEILYYNSYKGKLLQSFYAKRPEELAKDSPQFLRMRKKMSDDTEYYYYQVIYQFQKEYDPNTFVHFMPLDQSRKRKGFQIVQDYWRHGGGSRASHEWSESLKPIYMQRQFRQRERTGTRSWDDIVFSADTADLHESEKPIKATGANFSKFFNF